MGQVNDYVNLDTNVTNNKELFDQIVKSALTTPNLCA